MLIHGDATSWMYPVSVEKLNIPKISFRQRHVYNKHAPPGNFTLNIVRVYISYDKSLLKEFISTILINASHLSGVVRDRF